MIFGLRNAQKRRPAKPVGFSIRNTFAYGSKFVCSKGCFSQKIKVFEYSRKGVRMINLFMKNQTTLWAKIDEFALKQSNSLD